MQYSDQKNIFITFSEKNGLPLVIIMTYPNSDFRAVIAHK